jgi:hydrogenase-1 operon protein HyaF
MSNGNGASAALSSIGVRVEGMPTGDIDVHTANVLPLLHEVRHALARLLATGEETTIDLGSIPMAPGELDKIDAALGSGEVRVMLDSLGPSQIYETRFTGVWRITHRNAADEVVGRYIEIARIPPVLLAHETDMRRSLEELSARLGESSRGDTSG